MNQPVSNIPRTCEELGLCQMRTHAECHLPCDGPPGRDRFPFAPGVIDGPAMASLSRLRLAVRVVVFLVCLAAVISVVGFSAGYLQLLFIGAM